MFTERFEKPNKDNKYYIRKAEGGYNPCIEGKPKDKYLSVLANCVGYAVGRFNEAGEYGKCKYGGSWQPYYFITGCKNQGLKIQQEPAIGFMVWDDHIVFVERVISNTKVEATASVYGGTAFKRITYTKGLGKWGRTHKFLGFIPQPDVKLPKMYKVGDIVEFKGTTHYTNANAKTGKPAKKGKAKITRIYKLGTAKHPYHVIHTDKTSDVYGWVNEDDIS